MTTNLFEIWFSQEFVPAVKSRLKELGLEEKAILVLDNAPSHTKLSLLPSEHSNIHCVFLPPNTTSLMQPMDQGVLDTLKRHYRRKLMRRALDEQNEHKSMAEVKKIISVRDTIEWSSHAWRDITPYTLSSSWNMILPCIENPQVINQETSSDENPPEHCVIEDDEDVGLVELSTDEIIEFSLGNQGFQEEPLEDSIPMPEILSVSEAVNLLKTVLLTLENDIASTREEIFFSKALFRDGAFNFIRVKILISNTYYDSTYQNS